MIESIIDSDYAFQVNGSLEDLIDEIERKKQKEGQKYNFLPFLCLN